MLTTGIFPSLLICGEKQPESDLETYHDVMCWHPVSWKLGLSCPRDTEMASGSWPLHESSQCYWGEKKKKSKNTVELLPFQFFFNAATHGASEGKGHKGLWMRSTMFCYETAPKKTRLLLVYSVINNSILTYGSRETSKKFMSVLNWTELLIHIPTARGTTSVLYLQRPHSKTYTVCAYASTQLSTNDIKPALKTTQ